MPFNINEIDGVQPIRGRFPVDVIASTHELSGPEHTGQLTDSQIPSHIMRKEDHQNDPHTMMIDGRDVSADGTKLDTIESGAEVNNITDAQAQSLTGGTHSSWHHHDDFYYRKTQLQLPFEAEVHWVNLTNVPTSFPPSTHNHDDLYYTEIEIDEIISNYYTKAELDNGQLDNRYLEKSRINDYYYSKIELDNGQLDNRYYTEDEITTNYYTKIELDNGQLDNRYYTENEITTNYYAKIELDNGQLDNRYYTENEIDDILTNYYTIPQLNISGSSQVHWDNITNKPTINGAQWQRPVQFKYFGSTEPDESVMHNVGDRTIWFDGNQHIYELSGYNPPDGVPDENIDIIPLSAADIKTIGWSGDKWTVSNSIFETNQQWASLSTPMFATTPTSTNILVFEFDFKFVNRASRGEQSKFFLNINQISFEYKSRVNADPGNKFIRINAGSGDVDYTDYWTDDDTWYNIRIEIDFLNEVRVYYDSVQILTTTSNSTDNIYNQMSWLFAGGTRDGKIQGIQLKNVRAFGEGLSWQWDDVYTPVQNDMVLVQDDGDGKQAQYSFNGTNWIKISDPDFGNHGSLSGLNNDDHPQYLTPSRHIDIKGNPHDTTITQVIQADNSTDITTLELEELSNGSETVLHNHNSQYFTKNEINFNHYTKTELDNGQLDNRYLEKSRINDYYYSKIQLNNGQLDNRYFTEDEITTNYYTKVQADEIFTTELQVNQIISLILSDYYNMNDLNSGQLDDRYYTESEVDQLITAASFGVSGSVDVFQNLPANVNDGEIYIVKTTSGLNEEGFYRWDGSSWTFLANNTGTSTHNDLSGLNVGEYKHLTSSEYVGLTSGSSTNLHIHDDRYFTQTQISLLINEYYNKTELDTGSLDYRYYTETEIDGFFNDYYTKTELDNGQLDERYFTENEITTNYYSKNNLLTPGQSSIHWDNITNVPLEYNPSEHNHDNLYYRRIDIDSFLSGIYNTHYTKAELDNGQLDNRYLEKSRINDYYYSKIELDNGQLDNRYYTEDEITTNYYNKDSIDSLIAGAAFGIAGSVSTFNDLPATTDVGTIYIVKTTSGLNEEGFYRWDGSSWTFLANNTGLSIVDHGNLSGLDDDDHPQYAKKESDEVITGKWVFNNITIPSGMSVPTPVSVGEIFWNSNTNEFLIWNGSDWTPVSDTGNSVNSLNSITNNRIVVGDGDKHVKESSVSIENGNITGINYLEISRSGDTWMRLNHVNGDVDQGSILVYKYEDYATTMILSDLDDGPVIRLQQIGNGTESNPQYSSSIFQDNKKHNTVFSSNENKRFEIEENGTLHVHTTDYENLVTNDNDIPNKKYVDDISGSKNHASLLGLNNDDHPQYLNSERHGLITGNPHGITLSDVIDLSPNTDITAEELEELTSGLNTLLHNHNDMYFTKLEITSNYYTKNQLNTGQLDSRYYTETEIDSLLSNKSNVSHTHDDRYYTETEIDNILSGYSVIGHLHDDRYYKKNEVDGLIDTKSNIGHTHDDRYFTEIELSSNSGTSGAKRIGTSFIGGITSTNVQDVLQELKTQINSSVTSLQEAYEDESTIIASSGPVEIDASSENTAPLQITQQSSAPTDSLAAGQITVVDNELYLFNVNKNKWLTPTKTLGFGRHGVCDGHLLMAPGGVRTQGSGFKMAKNGTIVSVALNSTSSNAGKEIYIRLNDNIIYTIETDNSGCKLDKMVNVDFNEGDVVSSLVSSSGQPVRDVTLVFEYAWRI